MATNLSPKSSGSKTKTRARDSVQPSDCNEGRRDEYSQLTENQDHTDELPVAALGVRGIKPRYLSEQPCIDVCLSHTLSRSLLPSSPALLALIAPKRQHNSSSLFSSLSRSALPYLSVSQARSRSFQMHEIAWQGPLPPAVTTECQHPAETAPKDILGIGSTRKLPEAGVINCAVRWPGS